MLRKGGYRISPLKISPLSLIAQAMFHRILLIAVKMKGRITCLVSVLIASCAGILTLLSTVITVPLLSGGIRPGVHATSSRLHRKRKNLKICIL